MQRIMHQVSSLLIMLITMEHYSKDFRQSCWKNSVQIVWLCRNTRLVLQCLFLLQNMEYSCQKLKLIMHYLKRGIVLLSYYFVYLCGSLNGDYLLIPHACWYELLLLSSMVSHQQTFKPILLCLVSLKFSQPALMKTAR